LQTNIFHLFIGRVLCYTRYDWSITIAITSPAKWLDSHQMYLKKRHVFHTDLKELMLLSRNLFRLRFYYDIPAIARRRNY